MHKICR